MALELASGADFGCILHHFSSWTRLRPSRGQVRPGDAEKPRNVSLNLSFQPNLMPQSMVRSDPVDLCSGTSTGSLSKLVASPPGKDRGGGGVDGRVPGGARKTRKVENSQSRKVDFVASPLVDFSTFRLFGFSTFRILRQSHNFSTFRLFEFSNFETTLILLDFSTFRENADNASNCAGRTAWRHHSASAPRGGHVLAASFAPRWPPLGG